MLQVSIQPKRSFIVDEALVAKIQVDPENEHLLRKYPWRLDNSGYVWWHTKRRIGPGRYPDIRIYLAHLVCSPSEGEQIDHINGDKLDNRRFNLRSVPEVFNRHNQTRLRDDNNSGHRGVSWSGEMGKWVAYAKIKGRQYHLGYFVEVEQAAIAARKFREENMHGLTGFSV
jgi:hypothetical protein